MIAGSWPRILSSTRTRRWSVPGQDQGPSSAPGCSASPATRRTAIPAPSLAGTTPEHHRSPGRRAPARWCWPRRARNKRLANAIYLWAFSALSASPGARAFYDTRRAAGDTHHQALCALGNRLVGILHGCLASHAHYNETTAWAHRTSQPAARPA